MSSQYYTQPYYSNFYNNNSYSDSPPVSTAPIFNCNYNNSTDSGYNSYLHASTYNESAYSPSLATNSPYYPFYSNYSNTIYPSDYVHANESYYNANASTPDSFKSYVLPVIQYSPELQPIKTSRNICKEFDYDENNQKEDFGQTSCESASSAAATGTAICIKRRTRTAFKSDQRHYLLLLFKQNPHPSRESLEVAAHHLRVSVPILQTWFKNTRSKQKKLTNTKNL